MLMLIRILLGYCHQCGNAGYVGEFEIRAWKHHFNLCAPCLQRAAAEVITHGQTVPSRS